MRFQTWRLGKNIYQLNTWPIYIKIIKGCFSLFTYFLAQFVCFTSRSQSTDQGQDGIGARGSPVVSRWTDDGQLSHEGRRASKRGQGPSNVRRARLVFNGKARREMKNKMSFELSWPSFEIQMKITGNRMELEVHLLPFKSDPQSSHSHLNLGSHALIVAIGYSRPNILALLYTFSHLTEETWCNKCPPILIDDFHILKMLIECHLFSNFPCLITRWKRQLHMELSDRKSCQATPKPQVATAAVIANPALKCKKQHPQALFHKTKRKNI